MLVQKQATLERLEGKQAVLQLENGQELTIAKEELGSVQLGDRFSVRILPEQEALLDQEALARTLLNQILEDGQKEAPLPRVVA